MCCLICPQCHLHTNLGDCNQLTRRIPLDMLKADKTLLKHLKARGMVEMKALSLGDNEIKKILKL